VSTPEGIANVLKPVGMTSHDVVDTLRRFTGTRRIGHAGTLDPGAAGVLVLAIGRATRIAEFVAEADKEYVVEITFGRATDTGDVYGATVADTPAAVSDEALRAVLSRFVGTIAQVPPMASAVHYAGRRLYELHREGTEASVPPREVTIHALDVLDPPAGDPSRARLRVGCSKGTYIRGLCHDIGVAMGTGAYASFMVRTRVGRYTLEAAHTLEELSALSASGTLADAVEDPDLALSDLPAVDLTAQQRTAVLHGQGVPLFKVAHWQALVQAKVVRLRDPQGLVALAKVEQGVLKPFKVLRGAP
jgi:tRNA pseudouridine55 synthase